MTLWRRSRKRRKKGHVKKNTAEETLTKVMDFVARMEALHKEMEEICTDLDGHSKPVKTRSSLNVLEEMEGVLTEADEFDGSLGPGLKVGRLVSWHS